MFKTKEIIISCTVDDNVDLIIGETDIHPGKHTLAWYENDMNEYLSEMVFTDHELESLRQYLNGCHQKKLCALCGDGFTDEEKCMDKIGAVRSIRNRLGIGLKDSVDVYYMCLMKEAVE